MVAHIYNWHIFEIMKTMSPPNYQQHGFKATHALGHMMYGGMELRHMMYVSLIYGHKCMGTLCTSKWCTWAHEVAQVHELPQTHGGDGPDGTLLSWFHVYLTLIMLASAGFELFACHGSLMITFQHYSDKTK